MSVVLKCGMLGVVVSLALTVLVMMSMKLTTPVSIQVAHQYIQQDGMHVLVLSDNRTLEFFDSCDLLHDHHSSEDSSSTSSSSSSSSSSVCRKTYPVLLAFHPAPTTGRLFAPFARHFYGLHDDHDHKEGENENKFRIIAPSMPGHGGSSPNNYRTVESFGLDVSELLKFLHITRVSIFGGSWGGPHALAAAIAPISVDHSTSSSSSSSSSPLPSQRRVVVERVLLVAPVVGARHDFPGPAALAPFPANLMSTYLFGRSLPLAKFAVHHLIRPLTRLPNITDSSISTVWPILFTGDTVGSAIGKAPASLQMEIYQDMQRCFRWNIDGFTDMGIKSATPDERELNYELIGSLLQDVPIRIVHGAADRFVSPKCSDYTYESLKRGGANRVTLEKVSGEGHTFALVGAYQLIPDFMKGKL